MQRPVVPLRPLIAAAAIVALLAGCAAARPSETAEPTGAATATAAPSPAPVDAPTPRYPIECGEVLPLETIVAFLGDGIAGVAPVDLGAVEPPDASAGAQLGALDCAWDDGRPADTWTGPAERAQSARLQILPDAEAAALEYVAMYAGPGVPAPYGETALGPQCVVFEVDAYCELHGWLADAWIVLEVEGIVLDPEDTEASLAAEFTVIADGVVDAVAGAGEANAAWQSPKSAVDIADCGQLATPEEITAVTGLPGIRFGPNWDGPRIGQYWYTTLTVGALRCSIGFADRDADFGRVAFLPGGDWRYLLERDTWLEDGGAAVAVEGLEPDDAVLRCADATEPCLLDLRLGRDWVRISFPEVPPETVTYLPEGVDFGAARESIVELANRLVANAT